MYKDFRSGKKSIDGVTVSHVSRVCWISSISSPCSPEMNVQVPKWAMFGSLHLTIFLPANTLYISLHSLKLGNQLTSCMGWGFPWICHGFAMDLQVRPELSKREQPQLAELEADTTNEVLPYAQPQENQESGDPLAITWYFRYGIHMEITHTRAYHILYVYTFIWGRNFILLKWKCSDSWWYSSIKKI